MEIETMEEIGYGDTVTVSTEEGEEFEAKVTDVLDFDNKLTVKLKK